LRGGFSEMSRNGFLPTGVSGGFINFMPESPQQHHDEMFQKSGLYLEFLAERGEILRHKWIESKKAGQDIGFEKALIDWTMHHRSGWRAQRQKDR
jgi:hypothetical protein